MGFWWAVVFTIMANLNMPFTGEIEFCFSGAGFAYALTKFLKDY